MAGIELDPLGQNSRRYHTTGCPQHVLWCTKAHSLSQAQNAESPGVLALRNQWVDGELLYVVVLGLPYKENVVRAGEGMCTVLLNTCDTITLPRVVQNSHETLLDLDCKVHLGGEIQKQFVIPVIP